MKNDNLMKLNLQFFAEGGDGNNGAGADDGAGAGSQGGNDGGSQGNQDNPAGDAGKTGENKTFTQAELSAVAANEKKQGKQSIMNLFGVKDEKEAKAQAEAFKKWQESQKDLETKLKDSQTSLNEANTKAAAAENKLTLMMAGVNKDSIDDALAIAALKVTDDKDLNAVIEEMKKEPKYKGFFITVGSSGTGNPDGHQGTGAGGAGENIGERLGKLAVAGVPKKSNFFTN